MNSSNKKADIVCFGADWHGHPTSTHHLIRRLSKEHRVLWVNSLGMRTPELSSTQDLSRIFSRAKRLLTNAVPRKVAPNMWCIDPLFIPLQALPVAEFWNNKLLGTQLQLAMKSLKIQKPILLTALPNSVNVIPQLEPSFTIYYCLDDYARMPGVDSEVMAKKEKELAELTELILISGEHLRSHLEEEDATIEFLPHGVDVERFSLPTEPADCLRGISGPKIGFFGALDTWLDLDLIATVARQRPDWQFPIVGPTRIPLDALESLDNVHLLGAIPFDDIPGVAAGFDVGLLPFKVNDFTKAINPLKLREYFAAGLPAVSTSLPEVAKYAPLVSIADHPNDFIQAIEKMLNAPPTSQQLRQAVAEESWKARAQDVLNWIEDLSPGIVHQN